MSFWAKFVDIGNREKLMMMARRPFEDISKEELEVTSIR
jgi:hypothetical protein